jgi:hypothetical protein
VLLSRYIDGATTYGDLAEMCPLGRLRTLQVLTEMYPRPPASESRPLAHLEEVVVDPVDEPAPETARSASAIPIAPAVEDPDARLYREAFTRGTAAFIQSRFADAVEAFEACAQLRPGDAPAEVMLRRARRDLESR